MQSIFKKDKPIKKHRLLFLLYCIIIGLLANLFAVSFPIAVPFFVGNVAILVTLARLGPTWAAICFIFVTLPLQSNISVTLSIIQVILFQVYIYKVKISLIKISTIYFLATLLASRLLLPEAIIDKIIFLLIFTSISTALFAWSIKAANLLLNLYVNNKELRKQSLQHQLSFRVGLYSAIPATLLITLGLNGITSLEIARQMFHYQKDIDLLKESIDSKLKNYIEKVETIVKTTETKLTKKTLKLLVEQSQEFVSSLVTNDVGIVKIFYKADAISESLSDESVIDREYFYNVKATNSSFISDTFKGRSLGNDQLFSVSTPITMDNKFNGVLQLAIKLDSLLQVFNNQNDNVSHRILIDNAGKKVWGNNVGGDVGSVWIRPKDSEPMSDTFLSNSLFNPLNPIVFSKDANHLIISEKISVTGWNLYFFIDTDETFLRFSIYFLLALALITLILEVSVRLSNKFVRNYTQALEELVNYTQQWDGKSVDEDNLVFTQSALEIDTLAYSFLNMQQRVAGAHHAIISTMNEVRVINEELEDRVEKRTKELEQERDKANQLAAVKTRFLANMSHEIRTPITIIKGFTEQIIPITQGEVHNALCKINHNILHLQNVVNDILDAAKIDEGKMTIAEKTTDIIPLLESLKESMEVLARGKNLSTDVQVDIANIQQIMIDPFRLQQILLNFISNAVKFTSKGTIKLVANITNEHELYIAVIDEGIGISKQQASRLFEAFTQADSSTSRDFGGTGLGLFISKQLADAMCIKLNMQSELGVGSSFSVTLPKNKLIENSISIEGQKIEDSYLIPNWENHHILIVDDVDDIRELISIYLKDTGITIDYGQNGQQAIDLVKLKFYDLVLLDKQMPIMDGLSAARIIRESNKNIPLILLSADIFDTETVKNSPFNNSIAKPFTKKLLIETLKYFIIDDRSSKKIVDEYIDDELMTEYLYTLPSTLLLLKQLIKIQDKHHLEHELHKLKGTSACFGLNTISHCAANLHKLLKKRMITPNELDDLSLAVENAINNIE